MAKKLTLEEILVEMWEGVHKTNSFLSCLNDDAFAGYITAMSYANDARINKLGVGVPEVYNAVRRLMGEGKI